jgi:hypothetical protein
MTFFFFVLSFSVSVWPVVHFCYSERAGGGGERPSQPISIEGLCQHHSQMAAQMQAGTSPRIPHSGGRGSGHMGNPTFPGNPNMPNINFSVVYLIILYM